MTSTVRAPRVFSTYCAVTLAPPLPNTSAFLPATFTPHSSRMHEKPNASVLSAKSVPSFCRTSVLALPMAFTVSESSAQ